MLQDDSIPNAISSPFRNVSISGGIAPVRAYIEELLPDVVKDKYREGDTLDEWGRTARPVVIEFSADGDPSSDTRSSPRSQSSAS